MRVVLDIDDFSVVNNRLDLLLKLKETYPNFKVSLFTIPVDVKCDWGPYQNRKEFLEEVKKHLDWIQIIPHGYRHEGKEMKYMSYEVMKETMKYIEEAFNRDGLPFVKGFKAPHWQVSDGVIQALDEAGWWLAVDPRQPKMKKTKKFYCHTQPIDQKLDLDADVLKLHAHTYGTKNDLGKCMMNLMPYKMKEAEWCFVTDYIETK